MKRHIIAFLLFVACISPINAQTFSQPELWLRVPLRL